MSSLYALGVEDTALVGACLEAAATGPFFPDWEFETLFGLSRDQLRAVSKRWPENVDEEETEIAVRNTLANLCGYPHKQEERLAEMVSATPDRVRQLWDKVGKPD
ncbi:MAG: hypothetical protein ABI665_13655 [Vicinamibacterales bacterium]